MPIRIAFATNSGGLEDTIAERFGRAPTFTIVDVDLETGKVLNVRVVRNPGAEAGSGAGVKAVQTLINEGVQVAVGPQPGPNAMIALESAGIRVKVYTGMKVKEALEKVLAELRSERQK